MAIDGLSQGRILLSNVVKPTRLYTVDGPLAGPGIWGQFFLGESPETLTPFLTPVEHGTLGFVYLGEVEVPNRAPGTGVSVQFWAWDGAVWGTEVQNVPMNQIGMTDTIRYLLAFGTGFIEHPEFTRPAVVPPVPEPSMWVLVLAGGGLAVYGTRRRFKRKVLLASSNRELCSEWSGR